MFYVTGKRGHRRGLSLLEEPLPFPGGKGRHDQEEAPKELLDQLSTSTVSAVTFDEHGCITACTSTGSWTNKLKGGVSKAPHKGAGFWAEKWHIEGWIRKAWRKATG
ncbi:uncharacterized protein LAESUDRAFT_711480 [Laetiporus sulphureus 93-53]|uniref:N-terminal nucleophile aminohydrolase n=1 Tax=Laetiporus sulphureus 93-53 TaxID=1314785 RepID=A0A165GEA6_9APHY|nr:uncharacterized protein LAESUDRAFT_711480 [Laetiporus sulphureus 93-53]KZT10228.1 hypothetical protein LAESUDRAFT_711480 [Laetiporus sulphureus 93-53]